MSDDSLRFLIAKLRQGDYDGADLMRAWILLGELDTLRARVAELEERGVGYSQQTVDALTKERDKLRAALEAARDLSEIVRMPNAEHIADAHNEAVRKLREALR